MILALYILASTAAGSSLAVWAGVVVAAIIAIANWAIFTRLSGMETRLNSVDRRLSFMEGQHAKRGEA